MRTHHLAPVLAALTGSVRLLASAVVNTNGAKFQPKLVRTKLAACGRAGVTLDAFGGAVGRITQREIDAAQGSTAPTSPSPGGRPSSSTPNCRPRRGPSPTCSTPTPSI